MQPSSPISFDPQPSTSMPDVSATVDVWCANLARSETHEAGAWCLSEDEERRAARFHAERDSRRFRAARALLRHILSGYIDASPERVGFGYGAQGKPFLVDHPEVHFNLSHTADVLVVAIARGRRVGIDVEARIPEAVMTEVLGTVSSAPERALLAALSPAARGEQFSRLWTRKEAYIKADGRGMSLDLKRIDVLSLPNRVRCRETDAFLWTPCHEWTVRDLAVGPGLAAALVAEGGGWRTAQLQWPGDGIPG